MMNIIDPHLHLFDLKQGDYGWLKAQNPPFWPDKDKINRDFSEQDLILTGNLRLAGYIHVEAGFNNALPNQEIEWLNNTSTMMLGAVGCVDLTANPKAFTQQIERYVALKTCVGVRHILDDDAVDILVHPNCAVNFATLAKHNLSFDCQLLLSDSYAVDALIQHLRTQPKLRFIINHAGFANEQNSITWRINLTKLSQFNQVAIKCSGFEMVDRQYQTHWVKHVINECLATFGENRVMLASNFPLCSFSMSYQAYWEMMVDVCKEFPLEIKAALFSNTAKTLYRTVTSAP